MIINATASKRVTLGRLGENETRTVRFQTGDIKADFPGAEFMVLNRRPTESAAYPVSRNYITEGEDYLDWTIQSGDLLYQGMGECELVATVDEKIAKSQIYLTEVLKALDGSGDPPDPWAGWVQGVKDDADRAEAAADAAVSAAVHGPEIRQGVWYVWDAEAEEYVTTGVPAEGQPGHSPVLTASKSGKTTTIYTDGTQLAQIQDGQDGQGADVIDDAAGQGDTDKTWSADKLSEETGQLLNALDGVVNDITEIYSGKEIIVPGSINKLNPSEIQTGKGLDTDGTIYNKSGKGVSGFIKIDTDKTSLVVSGLNGAKTSRIGLPTVRICFYNASKNYVSRVNDISSNTVTPIPQNAGYARIEITEEYINERQPMVEFVNSISDISATFVDYVEPYVEEVYGITGLNEQVKNLDEEVDSLSNVKTIVPYGIAWDWWISVNSVDKFGNAYMGYVDTDAYAGVIRRQPDGTTQYKRLERSYNDDDHNGMATFVLSDGKILVIGTHGHSQDNKIICYRSKEPYSIDDMEKLSFDIPQSASYTYYCCYSQVFEYNGVLFDFMRCVCAPSGGGSSVTGYICLKSTDNGSTWTAYKAIVGSDAYISFNYTSDDSKILKGIYGKNPASGPNMIKGFTFDMSTEKFYDLSGTEIGHLIALESGSIDETNVAHYDDMTDIIQQGSSSYKSRLFYTAKAPKANNVFLYADSTDSTLTDFTYKLYNDGTTIQIGSSGVPFGNNHYISGICFGKEITTVYYAKATTSNADGNHELHKVKINNGSVESDEIITEATMCIIRPLFLGNGELAVLVGNYNDQTQNGYGGSFTAWELKPLFTDA